MKKRIRLKLVILFTIGLSLILILFSLAFSINSISHVEDFGKYTINVQEKNIKKNTSIFFLDLTRRIAFEHAVFFENIADLTLMLAKQVQYEIENNNDYVTTSILQMQQYKNTDFFIDTNPNRKMSSYCWGSSTEPSIEIINQIKKINSLTPLYKGIFNCKEYFLVNIWICNTLNYACMYPANKLYKNTKKRETLIKDYELLKKKGSSNDNHLIMTLPYKDDLTEKNIITLYYPIIDKSEQHIAYVGMDVALDSIIETISLFNITNTHKSKSVSDKLDYTKGFVFIISKDGGVIYFPDKHTSLFQFSDNYDGSYYTKTKQVNLKNSKDPEIRKLTDNMISNTFGTEIINLQSSNYIVAYSHIPSTNWILGYVMNDDLLMAAADKTKLKMSYIVKKMKLYFIWVAVIFLLVSILLAVTLFRTFYLKPINAIKNGIKKVGSGDFNINLCPDGAVEIAELATTFNYLGKEIRNYTENLKQEVAVRQAAETEIKIATDVQKIMLPKITSEFIRSDFDLYARLDAAKNVSGDFYDFFYLNDGRLAVLIGDVCGRGLSAAFFMAMSKVIIKNYSLAQNEGPADVLKKANNTLCEDNDAEMFSTAFLIFYNIETGHFTYGNAGHNNVVIFSENDNYNYPDIKKNLALGYLPDTNYDIAEGKLNKNESLFLYTDGILESISSSGKEYGEKNLRNIVINNTKLSSKKLCNTIVKDVKSFVKQSRLDDITLLLLKKRN